MLYSRIAKFVRYYEEMAGRILDYPRKVAIFEAVRPAELNVNFDL